MRSRVWWATVIAVALAASTVAGEARARKPRLKIRATHSHGFSPVRVMAVAELVGGEDLEDYYCVGLEWDWGDGTRSFRESDCDPFQAGMAIDRFFSARHVYTVPGEYRVRVSLVRAERRVARAGTAVRILGRLASSRWD
jgi:hypothetical protein